MFAPSLGWEYFRHAPWQFPVVGRTNYGMELSSSIVFTDSNPWLSILLKPFSSFLPSTFQFGGAWLLLCVIAQAIILWKIISIYTQNNCIKTIALVFMLFNPAWINRTGHLMLMSFFIFTAGIYLSLKYSKTTSFNNAKWLLLLCIAIGTHFYIYLLIFINWFVIVFYAFLCEPANRKKIILSFFLNILVSFSLFYVFGYLTIGGGASAGGFGFYKANLLFPILAGGNSEIIGLNFFHPGEYEGYNYFGGGLILLIIINIFFGKVDLFSVVKNNVPLFLFSLICFVLAISNVIAIGDNEFTIPLPNILLNILSNFRASGRFLWPVVMLIFLYFFSRTLKFPGKWPWLILLICTSLQIYDISKSWLHNHNSLISNAVNNSTRFEEYSMLWNKHLSVYKNIRWFPTQNSGPKWSEISYLSNKYNQNTDAIYYARVDEKKLSATMKKVSLQLLFGNYEFNTAYLMDKDYSSLIKLKKGDAIYKYKDLYILMPGNNSCDDCDIVNTSNVQQRDFDFSIGGIGRILLGDGWYSPEAWGVWSQGDVSEIFIPGDTKNVEIYFDGFLVPGKREHFNVSFYCGQEKISQLDVTPKSTREVLLNVSGCIKNEDNAIKLTVRNDNPGIPKMLFPNNEDSRLIAFGLKKIIMH
ncbi:DUF6311 domain-containing protein [Escherichia coli]